VNRIVVTGGSGQIGWELRRTLASLGEVLAPKRAELDFSRPGLISDYIRTVRPTIVVNAAAYTAVDRAESEPAEVDRINVLAVGALAEACADSDALLVHYSTDYVFDGDKTSPYTETDAPGPISAYGRSKLAGEAAIAAVNGRHIVLRTSWVYGGRGKNFLLTMLRLARERDHLKVVADQTGAPTWSRAIAEATAHMLRKFPVSATPPARLVNLSCAGRTNWWEFATRIIDEASALGLTRAVPVIPISTAEYPTPARRPQQSCLSAERLTSVFGVRMPHWSECLSLCLQDMAAVSPAIALE
jgi:dTDP-4-dehydrorhamnose reductase